jgi:hypothetical protein
MFPELPDNENMIGSVNLKTAMLISLELTGYDAGHCTHVTVYTLASVHEYEKLPRETDITCQRLGRGDGCLSGYSSVSRPVCFGRLVPMRFSTSNNSTQNAVMVVTSCPSLFYVSWNCVVLCYFLVFSRVLAVWKLYLLHTRICLF